MRQHLTGKRARVVGAIAAITAMVTPMAIAPAAQADRYNDVGGLLQQALTGKPSWPAYCSDAKGGLSPFLSAVLQAVANLVQGSSCVKATTAKATVAATTQTSAAQKVKSTSKAKSKKAKAKSKARAHR